MVLGSFVDRGSDFFYLFSFLEKKILGLYSQLLLSVHILRIVLGRCVLDIISEH